ncbi:dimethyl sulfoxide reductase anchor subunit [Cocleimonas flava]|jgi:DMSO reductase anchor subunit|uniref:DMSO reductase anchor subunit n=1 Tax=Cocleimonas flava TaxID=634765 RepID=A0A4R1ETE4_9GAMM|nr:MULTISPECIES: DmsC/YnfH family molybdoenzyme membrane anchor subunit [Cocleimonas]MEB8432574.1 dimethyl sulfoxide reductase anchor subunit [Cocleimonas sp. KMM 6892]MEC4715433.1 dimethyl sulfoxide reductase anchor subunit [Cocleimonas sp. KMM 6895]MEC4744948.1 dimethyl sulfoxide reductase anchor subunit [Cocleimonas sp. KMM 6896]TCJ83009.1 DMSO reductase anchor subunit [Cocleimonas flava]
MHPAFSVIFLTTLIGAGQGLFLALFTGQIFSQFKLMPEQHEVNFFIWGSALATLLLCVGLFASFFHLGHPERAWRTATKWRTSWLSREVIALPAAIVTIAAYGLAHYLGWNTPLLTMPGGTGVDATLLLGLIATVATYALFICTGMIYGCIKFLQEWHTPLTVINFILLGTASGFTIATALSAYLHIGLVYFYANWAIFFTVVALIFRVATMLRNRNINPKSDLRSAIGINHNNIRQMAQGSMGGSFNTREYFHGKSAAFVKSIKYIFVVLAFLVPLFFLVLSLNNSAYFIPLIAVLVQYVGLLAERWYFFADANHPQNLYYQQIS